MRRSTVLDLPLSVIIPCLELGMMMMEVFYHCPTTVLPCPTSVLPLSYHCPTASALNITVLKSQGIQALGPRS
jgi:hypothetical protein